MSKKKKDERYFCKSDLNNRGWTQTMIDKLLPPPVYRTNPYYKSASSMQTWYESTVLAAEETMEFKMAQEKIQKRKEKTKENKIKKEKEMVDSVEAVIPKNPVDEYIPARNIKRKFILHIGPTNSGKTYQSLERLKTAKRGCYLSPLRLLALEIYDKFNSEGVLCSMITGEEQLDVPGATIISSTIEILNTNVHYDVAVVDECQMIADKNRGHNWSRAILGLYADEIHLCMAPEAEEIVVKLINECGDDYEIVRHERNTPLKFEYVDVSLKKIKPGDALIVFSRRAVLSLAAELEHAGMKASVIYGSLPPASRREQVRRFNDGETQVVVSTDAIGMGINLPIKRVVFMETEKFDGTNHRRLSPTEVKQIAGRAGRYGIYNEGYVLSVNNKKYIEKCLETTIESIDTAYLGFTEELAVLPYKLPDIAKAWESIEPPSLYNKMDMTEMLDLYDYLKKAKLLKAYSKEDIYKLITCSIDIKNQYLIQLWLQYCEESLYSPDVSFPVVRDYDLSALETSYKCLDLYYQFSRKMKKDFDYDRLIAEKHRVEKEISKILKTKKNDFKKRCSFCGKSLPFNYQYGLCEDCYGAKYSYYY